ncbi:MAG TPA: hypothetical protein VJJ76_02320 [archaeon]|nr:hypothetical protein [archaeon]
MLFFKKKEPESISFSGKSMVPLERVRDLATRGFSEPDMIDTLRKEGYSPDEIDRALTDALKQGVSGLAPPRTEQTPAVLPQLEQFQPTIAALPQMPETSLPSQTQEYMQQWSQPAQPQQQQSYATEEYIEYLVKDRMSDVDEKVQEFTIRYQELEKRLQAVYDQLSALTQTRTSEQQQILNKLENWKDVLQDMDVRMTGLEKAFKDTLPPLIESVRSLSDLVERLKREA